MKVPKTLLASLLICAVALAGCTGGGSGTTDGGGGGGAIQYTASKDPVTQPYVFKSGVSADSYEWDFNDGSPKQTGKRVEHTWGFTNGDVQVTLRTEKGGVPAVHTRVLTLGNGENSPPEVVFELKEIWVQVGEPVRFSGAKSTDPDGDPVVFSWLCLDKGILAPYHGDTPGPLVGPPGSTTILHNVSNDLPEPDRVVEDFCPAFDGSEGLPVTRDATVEGAFMREGTYQIMMFAKDPKVGTTESVGIVYIYADDAKPDPYFADSFSGSLVAGRDGDAQELATLLGYEEPLDQVSHRFNLDAFNLAGWVNVTLDSQFPASEVDVGLYVGGSRVPVTSEEGTSMFFDQGVLRKGDYMVQVTLMQGLMVDYDVSVEVQKDMDPLTLYDAPH